MRSNLAAQAVVFAGPSIDTLTASRHLAAEFLPPVQRGDIDRLLARDQPPTAIGIIDGKFLQSLAVSPKEVLRAIDMDVKVFGASSMGALRAAECAAFGMVGVGKIYAEYASGRVDADDEVALVYDEERLTALSEPLINMRFAIAAGCDSGAFGRRAGDRFLRVAEELYFPHRTIAGVLALLDGQIPRREQVKLAEYFGSGTAPDTKRDDALTLLKQMREYLDLNVRWRQVGARTWSRIDDLTPSEIQQFLDEASGSPGSDVHGTMESILATIIVQLERPFQDMSK
jgi:hypothetical protein